MQEKRIKFEVQSIETLYIDSKAIRPENFTLAEKTTSMY